MKVATDKQVEKWKVKYGADLPLWFANVRAGEINIKDLSKLMNISVEGARKYFHRYYSDAELVGTKYNTTLKKSVKPSTASKDRKVHNPFNNPSDMRNMIKEVVSEEIGRFILEFTTTLIAVKEDIDSDSEGADNPLYNLSKEILKKKYNRLSFKEETRGRSRADVNMDDYGD